MSAAALRAKTMKKKASVQQTKLEHTSKVLDNTSLVGQAVGFAAVQNEFGLLKSPAQEARGVTSPYNRDGSPKRKLLTVSPQPVSTYGRVVNNFVNMHLPGAATDPSSPVRSVKQLSAEFGAELEESVNAAAESGLTEEQLQAQLQEQLHRTVQIAADTAREELALKVADAQRHMEAGAAADARLSNTRQRVCAAAQHTTGDIESYFSELERLLQERKKQLIAEANQRVVAVDEQLDSMHVRMAEIDTACHAAGEASEGPDLALLHKKPLIDEKLQAAMQEPWPQRAVSDSDLIFSADDSIVAAIMGLGEVTGGVAEDPAATATPELQEVIAHAEEVFDEADKDHDGFIGEQELKELVFYMYTKGGSYPNDLAARVKEEVEATLDRFDKDHNSTIDKTEFKRMLCSNPWKVLLPESARKNTSLMKHYFGL